MWMLTRCMCILGERVQWAGADGWCALGCGAMDVDLLTASAPFLWHHPPCLVFYSGYLTLRTDAAGPALVHRRHREG
ncbi:hypothetical protein DFH08DRAFT_891294 [Mycena albidolilacea]|uniref:Secreted protein n=1 Tax=Mycena albidolilacea TaxID=1033008 RepID=A0AAD6ZED6_9AGAR|nr:hypothetical protein DFH08DRAFT_891294 [Mycena albidolilacea]